MKRTNEEIRKDADDLLMKTLRNLYRENNYEHRQHKADEGEEQGIDYFFEILDRKSRSHQYLFLNQNKGTEQKIQPIGQENHDYKGKISFQLEVRHAKYFYYDLNQALIFTYCDLESNVVYWYAIQNDSELAQRINDKLSKHEKSMQIYIPAENILGKDTFDSLINEITYAYSNQRRKKSSSNSTTVDYSQLRKEIENKHIIDKIYYAINIFKDALVLPENVLNKLPPFITESRKSHLYKSTLHTDNDELFDLLLCLRVKNGVIIHCKRSDYVSGQKQKIQEIIEFFRINRISHISWVGKEKKIVKRVCVHDFWLDDSCDCARCNFYNLHFKNAQLRIERSDDGAIAKKGHIAALIGDTLTSFELVKGMYDRAQIDRDPNSYTISTYNLILLRKIITSNYFGSDRKRILDELEVVKWNKFDEDFVVNTNPYFLDQHKAVVDSKFAAPYTWQIDSLFLEIRTLWKNDKNGNWQSNSKYDDIRHVFIRLNSYIEFNNLGYSMFLDYKILVRKVVESHFALLSIKNPFSSKVEYFDIYLLPFIFLHIEPKLLHQIFEDYHINNLEIENSNAFTQRIRTYVKNLHFSESLILNDEYFGVDSFKVGNGLRNLVLILSKVSLGKRQINSILKEMISFWHSCGIDRLIPFKEIRILLSVHDINKKNSYNLIKLFKAHNRRSAPAIKNYLDQCTIDESNKYINKHINNFVSLIKEGNLKDVDLPITALKEPHLNKVEILIIKLLNKNFDPDLYYWSQIYGLIRFKKPFFNKFIKHIPDQNDPNYNRYMTSDFHNYRLDQTINLVYKYNLPFTNRLQKLITLSHKRRHNYYKWLMNLDSFNYENFEQYWILDNRIKYFIKSFKNSTVLKQELEKSLRGEYIEGVAKLYFELYSENS